MSEYQEVIDTIEVPDNTGMEGILHTLKTLLRKPKVQEITINGRGIVKCRRYAKENDNTMNAGVDFSDLVPSAIVRNTHVVEVAVTASMNAATVLSSLLDMVSMEQLKPLAFVSGADTSLWQWYRATTFTELNSRESLLGLPLHLDRVLPDTALVLAAGYGRDAALVDARTSFKIEMPQYNYPSSDIEVIQ